MSHAAHFLRRLDRVSDDHVELALTLYRDSELLREVLSAAHVPEGAPRLALSLDDPDEGPFVVVTREGRFVTCLGAGMRATGLPVISRERLDIAIGRVQRMRDEVAKVRHLAASGAESEIGRVFRRMQQRGPQFSREDAKVVLEVQPLIWRELRRLHRELAGLALEGQGAALSRRLDRPSERDAEVLLAYGDVVWGASHLSVLVDYELRGVDAKRLELERNSDFLHAEISFATGTVCHAHRALFKVAQCPKASLTRLKNMLGMDARTLRMFREYALATVANASTKLRAEALKAMGGHWYDGESAWAEHMNGIARDTRGFLMALPVEQPEKSDAAFAESARGYAAALANLTPEPSEAQRAEIPEDVARAALASSPISWLQPRCAQHVLGIGSAIPWLTRAKPEELFLPEAWVERLIPERGVDEVVQWLAPYAKEHQLERTAAVRRVEPKVGRNEGCPCGSGRKHKRCCAVALRNAA